VRPSGQRRICTHKIVETELLWDDFIGTDTKGGTYSKEQSIEKSKAHSTRAHDCRLLQTQVHFYSDDVAVVFGSETDVEPKPGGDEERRCLYWGGRNRTAARPVGQRQEPAQKPKFRPAK